MDSTSSTSLIDAYLRQTSQLRGVVVLMDARRDPTDDDLALLEYLADLEIPTLVAITKIDKLGKQAREEALKRILLRTGLDPEQVIPCSAHTGEGHTEVAEAIVALIEAPPWHKPEAEL